MKTSETHQVAASASLVIGPAHFNGDTLLGVTVVFASSVTQGISVTLTRGATVATLANTAAAAGTTFRVGFLDNPPVLLPGDVLTVGRGGQSGAPAFTAFVDLEKGGVS
jgi:hypothetical protein